MIDITRSHLFGSIPHGFLGRTGGASSGIFDSLNVGLGSADDKVQVQENRRRAVNAVLPGAKLVTLHQVHSATAVAVSATVDDDARPHADALVTNTPGLALGILTADCGPILFADSRSGVIGAAHAGWKGALTGVVCATIGEMEKLGAARENIVAAVGPCIGRASYEVDDGFRERFESQSAQFERFFSSGARAKHHQFDLEGFITAQLAAAGLRHIHALGEDTYRQPARYFSYRRTTHLNEPDYGRQISLIALPD
jgi:polyphenol oxidase